MKSTRWVVIDTETDGLCDPIHVVELSGQLMEGWERVGEPFSMLLNHDVFIPPEAVAVHGYTQEYLRKHGEKPSRVYAAFRDYARDYPLVAHNLSYDWNRCLEPEWGRLGVPQIGRRGFCCMMLARRLVHETTSYRLESLKECFQMTPRPSHQAKSDVLTIVELFDRIYRNRLESMGLSTYDEVEKFAKTTPVAKCLDKVRGCTKTVTQPPSPKDEWYYLDADRKPHGPLPARQASERVERKMFYVWRQGMSEWVVNYECQEFISLSQSPATVTKPNRKFEADKTMNELIGLCRGVIADGRITTAEVTFLNSWLQDAGFITEWPASEIAQTMERILEDGVITKEEKEELKTLIQTVV